MEKREQKTNLGYLPFKEEKDPRVRDRIRIIILLRKI